MANSSAEWATISGNLALDSQLELPSLPKVKKPSPAAIAVSMCVGVAAAMWLRGSSFYPLSLAERATHPDFRVLSPSGDVGHTYGVIGTVFIVANLLYLVRRRLAKLPLGSMRAWLDAHVVTGFLGSTIIVYHSAFQLRSALAITSAACLMIVVLTGVVGRYLHAIAPTPDPKDLDYPLLALGQLAPSVAQSLEDTMARAPMPRILNNPSFFAALTAFVSNYRTGAIRRRVLLREGRRAASSSALGSAAKERVRSLVKQAAQATFRECRSAAANTLLRSWRSLHRFLAIVMLLSVAVHVSVAIYFGYLGVFAD